MNPRRNPCLQRQGMGAARCMRGESLIGLLMGLAMGLGVLVGGISLWMDTLKAQRNALQETRMHQDLRAAMDWMAQDIRQAQYVHNAWALRTSADCKDAFCGAPEDFSISDNQIEFSFDRDDDGIKDNTECTGFQLRAFELRTKTYCTSAQWQSATNAEHVKITSLKFTPRCTWVNGSVLRHIDMALTAALPNDPLTTVTHQQSVHLRNAQPASVWPGGCS